MTARYKLVIFDMDQTLIDETLYLDAEYIIKHFNKFNINMSIASFNKHAQWFCDRYDISKYFDIICGYYNTGKLNHIKKIKEFYNANGYEIYDRDIIFFDDDIINISEVRNNSSITCVKINPKIGINKNVIKIVIN
jgi:predicted phosphatase